MIIPSPSSSLGLIRSDGTVSMTLREVLTIYGLRIRYEDTEWIYQCKESRATIHRAKRSPGSTPFDPLREIGKLKEQSLITQIIAYNHGKKLSEQIKSEYRPYRKGTEEMRRPIRNAPAIRNKASKGG